MDTNFGFSFGVPPFNNEGENTEGNLASSTQSQDYSIDLSQITPPTFRFGMRGEIVPPSDPIENNVDDESFLAEPSISVGQFDANYTFDNYSSNSLESLKPKSDSETPKSVTSVPILIEEPLIQPDYLEEPAPHSVEDLLKATIDGSSAEVFLDSSSWENVGIEEIEEAQAEFDSLKEAEAEEIMQKKVGNGFEIEKGFTVNSVDNLEIEGKVDNQLEEIVETEQPKAKKSKASPVKTKPVKSVAVRELPAKAKGAAVEAKTSEAEEVLEFVAHAESNKTPAKTLAITATKTSAKTPTKTTTKAPAEAPITIISAKRERKTVERLSESVGPNSAKASIKNISTEPKGSGTKLGEINLIEKNLSNKLASDKYIVLLHRLIYDRVGEARQRKANIRAFNGLGSVVKIEAKLQKMTVADLKEISQFLGLSGASDKASLVSKISEFLVKPSDDVVKAVSVAATKKAVSAKNKSVASKPVKSRPVKSKAAISKPAISKPAVSKRTKSTASAKKPSSIKKTKPTKTTSHSDLSPETVDSEVEFEVEKDELYN